MIMSFVDALTSAPDVTFLRGGRMRNPLITKNNPVLVLVAAVSVLLFVITTGCSTTHYEKAADEEVYRVITEKTAEVPGMLPSIDIAQPPLPELVDLPQQQESDPAFGEAASTEQGAYIIGLEKALSLAFQHNRGYQSRKEDLYLQALSLTLDRHRYTPIFSGRASGTYDHTTRDTQVFSPEAIIAADAPDLVREIGALTGQPADLLESYANLVAQAGDISGATAPELRIVDEESVSGTTDFGVDLLLKGGGRIAVNLTSNFLRFVTGDSRVDATSALLGSFTQPLLRGAGSAVAAEELAQAERDLLYNMREFTRFRKEFTVEVASSYYQVLQNRDAVRNNWRGYQDILTSVERARALAEEGRGTQADLGRYERNALNTELSWIGSVRSYRQSMDQFKIQLGLPTDAPIVLDPNELDELTARGIIHPSITPENAVDVALVTRLDLYNVRDRVDDSERKVHVAKNSLKPDLDLVLTGTVDSEPDTNSFEEFDFERARWGAGLDLDLPFDRKAERNALRSALIAQERAVRGLTLAEDNIKLEVRDAWRRLDQAKRNYEISVQSVELNQRLVEEQSLRMELGRATAIDQVDAQNALIQAQNARTAALVDHTIARLEFWRDMGILFVKESGQWEEVTDDVQS
jgi:outer membrane protein TolC